MALSPVKFTQSINTPKDGRNLFLAQWTVVAVGLSPRALNTRWTSFDVKSIAQQKRTTGNDKPTPRSSRASSCRYSSVYCPRNSVRRLEKKVVRKKIVLAAMPELSLKIVEFTREHGRVTIGQVIRLTGASRNTLKQHFPALVERGTLNQHGSGRGVWYELR